MAFHLGLHCLNRLSLGTEIENIFEILTCDPFKYIMDHPIVLYAFIWENPSVYNGLTLFILMNYPIQIDTLF